MNGWKRYLLLISVIGCVAIIVSSCQFSHQKEKELSKVDSLTRDSSRKAYNPYKAGQGTSTYDQQKDQLGNLDSLVTPH